MKCTAGGNSPNGFFLTIQAQETYPALGEQFTAYASADSPPLFALYETEWQPMPTAQDVLLIDEEAIAEDFELAEMGLDEYCDILAREDEEA